MGESATAVDVADAIADDGAFAFVSMETLATLGCSPVFVRPPRARDIGGNVEKQNRREDYKEGVTCMQMFFPIDDSLLLQS